MVTLTQVRSVNWGKKHLWEVKFPEAPSKFSDWFPASEVEIPEIIIDTYTVEYYNRPYELPMLWGQQELRITFYDDSDYTLFKWFRNWVNNEILHLNNPQNSYVSRLDKSCKKVHLLKLTDTKELIEQKSYLVYPKLTLNWEGTSMPEAQVYSVSFIVAGEISAQQ